MSMIQAGYMAANMRKFANRYSKIAGQTQAAEKSFTDTVSEKAAVSVVDEYKKAHPESASHVEGQVAAGKAVRERNGAGNVSTEDMTMEEYQRYFNALLDTIPYDSTRIYDETILSISDEGWEQMKKDPDYEAWVLGYFVEDRAVRNPFFGWGGNCGCMIVEQFGASIDEHHGVSYQKSVHGKDKDDSDDEDSWWIERHKRNKKLIEEQSKRARERSAWLRETAQQEFEMQQFESRRRLQQFLEGRTHVGQPYVTSDKKPYPVAAMTYDSIICAFSSHVAGK